MQLVINKLEDLLSNNIASMPPIDKLPVVETVESCNTLNYEEQMMVKALSLDDNALLIKRKHEQGKYYIGIRSSIEKVNLSFTGPKWENIITSLIRKDILKHSYFDDTDERFTLTYKGIKLAGEIDEKVFDEFSSLLVQKARENKKKGLFSPALFDIIKTNNINLTSKQIQEKILAYLNAVDVAKHQDIAGIIGITRELVDKEIKALEVQDILERLYLGTSCVRIKGK